MAYRGYSIANGLIVDPNGFGDFTTVSSAIAAATSGMTIYVRPGTYTENPTLPSGINLATIESEFGSSIIVGKITFSGSGISAISGLTLQTNGDYLLVNSGTGQIGLFNCTLNITNHTGISLSSTGIIDLTLCNGDTTNTGIAIYSITGNGVLAMFFCSFANDGSSTTASTNSTGTVGFRHCDFNHPFTCSGTGNFTTAQVISNCGGINVIPITLNGSGIQSLEFSDFNGGTASALSVGGTASATHLNLSSSAGNAIAGSGTLNKALLVFTGGSSTIAGTLTVNTFTTA
jgi:hypothetical protein